MEYELMAHRGLQPNSNIPLMTFLYMSSKYKKEREEAAAAAKNQR